MLLVGLVSQTLAQGVGRTRLAAPHQDPAAIVCALGDLPRAPGDEIWLISSRAADPCHPDAGQLDCRRFDCGEFREAPLHDLVQGHHTETGKKTIVYIHGNRTDLVWSMARGLQVYDRLFHECTPHIPVRYVIWSWPADPQPRKLQEYHENSWRSMQEGNVLATFLGELDGPQSVGLVGYSLGAQALVSGLEQQRNRNAASQIRYDVVAIAPALQRPWVYEPNPFAGAGELTTQITQLQNSRDRALRFHHVAVKHLPPGCSNLGLAEHLEVASAEPCRLDVGRDVGREHSIVRYLEPDSIRTLVRDAVLGVENEIVVEGKRVE